MTGPTLLSIVREDGRVERLGAWHHEAKRLTLEREGFPFLGVGEHVIEGDLPWLFRDMCPSGYLGAKFAAEFPELSLPSQPNLWGPEHCLRALTQRGEDLTGNLLVGEASLERYRARPRQDAGVFEQLDAAQEHSAVSSVGGDRPKFALNGLAISPGDRVVDVLVKFSPPLTTPVGWRWRNLLIAEQLIQETLRQFGVPAAESLPAQQFDRRLNFIVRFERSPLGRIGAATFAWLAVSRGEAELNAPAVAASLARDGLLGSEDAALVDRLHAFSAAIGNTDAHLGNYGLLFDAQGRARLAPSYDVSPMLFAPRFDEIPSAVRPRTQPIREDVRPWVEALLGRAETSLLDADFLATWVGWITA